MHAVHFWTLRPVEDVLDWDPDAEPDRPRSGYGHSFLELFVRMTRSQPHVTIGAIIPPRTGVVVVSLEELSEWRRHGSPRLVLALARAIRFRTPALVLLRVDVHLHVPAPLSTTLEMMPTFASVTDPTAQRSLPLLPQRGLVPRAAARGDHIEVVGAKLFSQNVPEWAPELQARLADLSVSFRLDTESSESRGWEDFSDLDVVLCTQPPTANSDPRRKPPTTLINAWVAGAIPICSADPGYLELLETAHDAIVASGPNDIAAAVNRLRCDPAQAAAMFEASRRKGVEFRTAALVPRWRDAITSARPMRRSQLAADVVIALAQLAFGDRVGPRLRQMLWAHRSPSLRSHS